jgi:hypothetical protein
MLTELWSKWNIYTEVVGIRNITVALENSLIVLSEVKYTTVPLLSNLLK